MVLSTFEILTFSPKLEVNSIDTSQLHYTSYIPSIRKAYSKPNKKKKENGIIRRKCIEKSFYINKEGSRTQF